VDHAFVDDQLVVLGLRDLADHRLHPRENLSGELALDLLEFGLVLLADLLPLDGLLLVPLIQLLRGLGLRGRRGVGSSWRFRPSITLARRSRSPWRSSNRCFSAANTACPSAESVTARRMSTTPNRTWAYTRGATTATNTATIAVGATVRHRARWSETVDGSAVVRTVSLGGVKD
jgi:hypothetical protein